MDSLGDDLLRGSCSNIMISKGEWNGNSSMRNTTKFGLTNKLTQNKNDQPNPFKANQPSKDGVPSFLKVN